MGYAQGVFDPVTQRYIVNPSDSHTWVEVYFPTYGWVLFEPSGFRAPEVRGGAADGTAGGGGPNPDAADLSMVDDFLDELEEMDLSNFQPLEPSDGQSPVQEFIANLGAAVLALVVIGGSLVALGVLYLLGSLVRDWLQKSPRSRRPAVRANGQVGRSRWLQYAPRVYAGGAWPPARCRAFSGTRHGSAYQHPGPARSCRGDICSRHLRPAADLTLGATNG